MQGLGSTLDYGLCMCAILGRALRNISRWVKLVQQLPLSMGPKCPCSTDHKTLEESKSIWHLPLD